MDTDNKKQVAEKISAYIDDALDAGEVESLLAKNGLDKHFSTAARYHMVGDALRGELSDASLVDVSAQIHLALRNESFDAVESAQSHKQENSFNLLAWMDDFFGSMARPLLGMAVATSVAMLVIVTVVQIEAPESGQALATLPATTQDALIVNKQAIDNLLTKQQQMAEFDAYLTEHAEFAAQDTLQGRIPYVRAVSYETE